jgi:hypothetical protein
MAPLSTGSTAAPTLSVDYKYILVNTLTDGVLAELPFVNVSYSRTLNEAGTFSGSLPITAETTNSDIYNSTLPGKTSLYILRNNVCVWGGIVSTRNYDISEKILDVTADEFVSYLDRRFLWKTYSLDIACTIEIFEDPAISGRMIGKVTLSGSDTIPGYDETFGPASRVYISFGPELSAEYNGNFKPLDSSLSQNSSFGITENSFHFGAFYRPVGKKNFQPMKETNISADLGVVRFKQKTDDFIVNLLNEQFSNDLRNLSIPNEVIGPAELARMEVESYSRSNNVATITVKDEDGPHFLVPGQIIAIRDLPGFSTSRTRVISVVDENTFTYPFTGVNLPTTTFTSPEVPILAWQRINNTVTISTSTPHGLQAGDIVRVSGLEVALDSTLEYYVNRIGTSNPAASTQTNFQILNTGKEVKLSKAGAGATISRVAIVEAYSAGPFPDNANIGITFESDPELDGSIAYIEPLRGYELKSFKEIIDSYATDIIGFDYRIDCSYDAETNSFSKNFVFLPLRPPGLPNVTTLGETELASVADFGADQYVFEYPGNISSVRLTETIEGGGTRAWVQGRIEDLSAEASQPYGARGDHDFLNDGWPIFDMKITKDKVSNNRDLKDIADKLISQAQLPISTFEITVNGTINPVLGSYRPGDWCIVSIDDPFVEQRLASFYENKGDTSRTVLLRKIAGFGVTITNNPGLPEEVRLELITEPGVDVTGSEAWRT